MLKQGERVVAVKNCFGTEYVIETNNRKKIQSVQIIVSTGRRRTNLNKALAEEYIVYVKHTLYRKNGNRTSYEFMEVPSQYLNGIGMSKSPKSRKVIANVFRLMYSFFYLMGYTMNNLNYEQALSLVDFLKNSSRYVESNEDFARESNSVSQYLSHIRSYVKWLGYGNDHPMLLTDFVIYNDKYGNRQIAVKNEVTIRHYSEDNIRYHIKPLEYLKIRESEYPKDELSRLTLRCIVDLMYLHGLRLGEVLGLTLEDVYKDSDGEVCVVIRNRFTKDKFRFAKGCMKVSTPFAYTDKDYCKEKVGYEVVYLEKEAVRTLNAYMLATHHFLPPRRGESKKAFALKKKNYRETTVADTVADYIKSDFDRKKMRLAPFRSIDGKNHYLFLNSRFNPLNDKYWNRLLRAVMINEHIGVDNGRKKFGLNHRFRHGFAIFQLHVMKHDPYVVMKLMRHNSLESLEPYLKLTDEDIMEIRTEHTKEMFDVIMETREKFRG